MRRVLPSFLLLLTACASAPPPRPAAYAGTRAERAEALLEIALQAGPAIAFSAPASVLPSLSLGGLVESVGEPSESVELDPGSPPYRTYVGSNFAADDFAADEFGPDDFVLNKDWRPDDYFFEAYPVGFPSR